MRAVWLGRLAALTPLVATSPLALTAQEEYGRSRGVLGISAMVARPVGEFREFVDWGGGLGLYGLVNFDNDQSVALRLDGSFVIYGHESFEAPLSETVRRVTVDVSTNNTIFNVGLGPQFTLGQGTVRPYLFGTMGFSYFATISSVGGTADFDNFANSTNFDDLTFALTAGSGLMVDLSRGRRPVSLDLSVQSLFNGQAEYLTRGDIVENADGSLTLFPVRSQANLLTFRVGVAIGM